MTLDVFFGLVAFAFVTSITPGPNNLMLMASGANFGVWRTGPHMFGVALGFTLMLVLVGFGLVGLFEAYPLAHQALKVVSVAYLVFLAWKIATSAPPPSVGEVERREAAGQSTGRPMTFLQAALFQWVNPKAWAMALTAVTVYAPTRSLGAIVAVGLVFGLVNLPSVGAWAMLGQQMRRVLTNARRLHTFNITMAMLLVASLAPVIWS